MTAALLFLTLMLGSLGFSAIRLSNRAGARELPAYRALTGAPVFRYGGGLLIALSLLPLAMGTWPPAVGFVCWLFCLLPLSALPGLFYWPFRPDRAVWLPPLLFAIMALVMSIRP